MPFPATASLTQAYSRAHSTLDRPSDCNADYIQFQKITMMSNLAVLASLLILFSPLPVNSGEIACLSMPSFRLVACNTPYLQISLHRFEHQSAIIFPNLNRFIIPRAPQLSELSRSERNINLNHGCCNKYPDFNVCLNMRTLFMLKVYCATLSGMP